MILWFLTPLPCRSAFLHGRSTYSSMGSSLGCSVDICSPITLNMGCKEMHAAPRSPPQITWESLPWCMEDLLILWCVLTGLFQFSHTSHILLHSFFAHSLTRFHCNSSVSDWQSLWGQLEAAVASTGQPTAPPHRGPCSPHVVVSCW